MVRVYLCPEARRIETDQIKNRTAQDLLKPSATLRKWNPYIDRVIDITKERGCLKSVHARSFQ